MPGRGYVVSNRARWEPDLKCLWAPSGIQAERFRKRYDENICKESGVANEKFLKKPASCRRNYKLRARLHRKHTKPITKLTEAQKEKMANLRVKNYEEIKKDPRSFGCKKDLKSIRSLAKKMAWESIMGKQKLYTRKESKMLDLEKSSPKKKKTAAAAA